MNSSGKFRPFPVHRDWDHFWNRSAPSKGGMSWSKRRIIEILKPFVSSGQKALDAGCGSGFFSKYFLDSGMDVVSCDYSDEAIAMTRKLLDGRGRVLKLDLSSPEFARDLPERFDLIFSDGLLEHFTASSQERILANVTGRLSKGGKLVTFVPNRWSPWQIIRPVFMPGIYEEPFTLQRLIALHRRADLRIVRTGGLNVFPVAFSPDKLLGRYWGMLLYVIAQKVSDDKED